MAADLLVIRITIFAADHFRLVHSRKLSSLHTASKDIRISPDLHQTVYGNRLFVYTFDPKWHQNTEHKVNSVKIIYSNGRIAIIFLQTAGQDWLHLAASR
jgi:hypothetical protein